MRRFTEKGVEGCRIVANLHADTLEQAREHVVGECGAREEGFQAFELFIPLVLAGSRFTAVPRVQWIHYARDADWHVWEREAPKPPEDYPGFRDLVDSIGGFLSDSIGRGVRRIEDVREQWLKWCERNGPDI